MPSLQPVDAIVTDPPYGLEFMGKEWDHGVPSKETWRIALNALKPAGYMLCFGGTRTFHRMACAIEDAGFEIRDCLMWMYGQGFPKAKSCLKPAWEPVILARKPGTRVLPLNIDECRVMIGQRPNIDGDAEWGEGQRLCGSCAERAASNQRPVTPATRESIAARNAVQTLNGRAAKSRLGTSKTDTGCSDGMNLGGMFTSSSTGESGNSTTGQSQTGSRFTTSTKTEATTALRTCNSCGRPITFDTTSRSTTHEKNGSPRTGNSSGNAEPAGRWPANLVHDGSDEVMEAFARFGESNKPNGRPACKGNEYDQDNAVYGKFRAATYQGGYLDTGTAARFYYCAKASKADRDEGLEGMPEQADAKAFRNSVCASCGKSKLDGRRIGPCCDTPEYAEGQVRLNRNTHPTVKPTALMEWLIKLVARPGETVLDPFAGSGSTLKACARIGRHGIGIEKHRPYWEIAAKRTESALKSEPLLEGVA
jgi:DNA modification methylase